MDKSVNDNDAAAIAGDDIGDSDGDDIGGIENLFSEIDFKLDAIRSSFDDTNDDNNNNNNNPSGISILQLRIEELENCQDAYLNKAHDLNKELDQERSRSKNLKLKRERSLRNLENEVNKASEREATLRNKIEELEKSSRSLDICDFPTPNAAVLIDHQEEEPVADATVIEEMKQLQQDIITHEQGIVHLKNACIHLERDKEKNRQELQTTIETLQETKIKCNQYEVEIESTRKELDKVTARSIILEELNLNHEGEIGRLKEELGQTDARLHDLEDTNNKQVNEFDRLQETHNNDLVQFKNKMKQNQLELKILEDANREKEAVIRSMESNHESEIFVLQEKLDLEYARRSEVEAATRAQLKESNDLKTSHTIELGRLQEELTQQESLIYDLKKLESEKSQDLTTHLQELQQRNNQVRQLESECENKKEAICDLQQNFDHLKKSRDDLADENLSLKNDLKNSQAKVSALVTSEAVLTEKVQTLIADLESSEKKIKQLEVDCDKTKRGLNDQNKALQILLALQNRLDKSEKSLYKDKQNLSDSLQSSNDIIQRLQDTMDKKEKQLTDLRGMVKKQRDQMANMEESQKANGSLQIKLEEKETLIVMLEQQTSQVEETNQRLSSDLSQTQRQLRVFTNKRKNLDQGLESLSQQLKEERLGSKNAIEERDREIISLKARIENERRGVGDLENIRHKQENDIMLLKQSLAHESARVADSESKCNKYRQDVLDATCQLEQLKAEGKQKEEQLTARLSSTESKLEKTIEEVNGQLKNEQKLVVQLLASLEEYQQKLENERNDSQTKDVRYERLQVSLEKKGKEYNTIHAELDERTKTLSKVNEDLAQAQKLLKENDDFLYQLASKFEEMTRSTESKDKPISEIRTKLELEQSKSMRQLQEIDQLTVTSEANNEQWHNTFAYLQERIKAFGVSEKKVGLETIEEQKREINKLKNLLEEQRSENDVKDQTLLEMTDQYTKMAQSLNEKDDEIRELTAEYEKMMLSMVEKDQTILNAQEDLAIERQMSSRQLLDGEKSAEIRVQEMGQQLESLYAAFGVINEEQDVERRERRSLENNLTRADYALARQIESPRGSNFQGATGAGSPKDMIAIQRALMEEDGSQHLIVPQNQQGTVSRDRPLVSGILSIRSKNKLKKWKDRYCWLHHYGDQYQLDLGEGKKFTIQRGVTTVEVNPSHPRSFIISIDPSKSKSPVIHAAASSADIHNQWLEALYDAL